MVPRFDGPESILLATAMLGATVMPHAVYLHWTAPPGPGPPRRRRRPGLVRCDPRRTPRTASGRNR
ncbi:divalent metal cation transporter [Rhodococcus aetherivorans]|uniref:divalent metal cation transporter n=1 Tax=Rhodococcus aetherivorans TaxID=191292 RepID=UPI003F62A582